MIRNLSAMARFGALRRAVLAGPFVAGAFVATAAAAPFTDQTGDALCTRTVGMCSMPYDITSVNAVTAGGSVIFRVYLTQTTVQAPSQDSSSLNMLTGYIDIDTDQNVATGTPAWGDYFGEAPPWPDPAPKVSGLGDEYYVDLYQEFAHAGFAEVYDGTGTIFQGLAPIVYGTNSFEVTVALSLLGGDDGLLNYDVVVGDATGLTDEAPDYLDIQNGASPAATSLPEPSSAALFGLILAAIGLVRRRASARTA